MPSTKFVVALWQSHAFHRKEKLPVDNPKLLWQVPFFLSALKLQELPTDHKQKICNTASSKRNILKMGEFDLRFGKKDWERCRQFELWEELGLSFGTSNSAFVHLAEVMFADFTLLLTNYWHLQNNIYSHSHSWSLYTEGMRFNQPLQIMGFNAQELVWMHVVSGFGLALMTHWVLCYSGARSHP